MSTELHWLARAGRFLLITIGASAVGFAFAGVSISNVWGGRIDIFRAPGRDQSMRTTILFDASSWLRIYVDYGEQIKRSEITYRPGEACPDESLLIPFYSYTTAARSRAIRQSSYSIGIPYFPIGVVGMLILRQAFYMGRKRARPPGRGFLVQPKKPKGTDTKSIDSLRPDG